jgi:hypothetical protein
MPLSVVRVGRLAMKSFLFTSNREPGSLRWLSLFAFATPSVDRICVAKTGREWVF